MDSLLTRLIDVSGDLTVQSSVRADQPVAKRHSSGFRADGDVATGGSDTSGHFRNETRFRVDAIVGESAQDLPAAGGRSASLVSDVEESVEMADVDATEHDDATPAALTVTVVLDAESFAAAFASAIGERSHPAIPTWAASTAAARKRSFWASTWHADVVLMLVALAIVLVVLLAWAT